MHDNIDIELVLKKNNYGKIYQINYIIMIILLIFIYIIFTYKIQFIYETEGKILSGNLVLYVNKNDLKYINNRNILKIDDKYYYYHLIKIDSELDNNNLNDYCYVYLKIPDLKTIDNYVYKVTINKEEKTIAEYLKINL